MTAPLKHADFVGQRFGHWAVLRPAAPDCSKFARALCLCDGCGTEQIVRLSELKNGRTSQCRLCAATTHGMSGTNTYRAWKSMKDRCLRPGNKHWKDYGGRGITICQRWVDSFEAFLADMGECPAGLSIERTNNDRGYEPGNCIWADAKTQAANRRPARPRRRASLYSHAHN